MLEKHNNPKKPDDTAISSGCRFQITGLTATSPILFKQKSL